MPSMAGRVHLRTEGGVELSLMNHGLSKEDALALIELVKRYGRVHIPYFGGDNDAWGMHTSLQLYANMQRTEFYIEIESRPHW